MSLQNTPNSNRLHIGVFGKRNSGKSSLVNALTGQNTSLVSDVLGTTTDPILKAMEIKGLGPCVFIDTAGFDDVGKLGEIRVKKTREITKKTDIGIVVFADFNDISLELEWINCLKEDNINFITVINKCDELSKKEVEKLCKIIFEETYDEPVVVGARDKINIDEIYIKLSENSPSDYEKQTIVSHLLDEGDVVLLVAPQDIQAPKGRLILPQVQTIRDLLDKHCIVTVCTTDKFELSLSALNKPPKMIITDSQVFKYVYDRKPKESLLTSFSILFANYKGDIDYFIKGAKTLDTLTKNSKILISEACTHVPLSEDIGREKIPNMLRKKIGQEITVDVVCGNDFPKNLEEYDLVIQCGACMFNRKLVMSRVLDAKRAGVPMTNYGIVIAYINGILGDIYY